MDPDGRETTSKAAIYPTVGNAFNLDFGRDYSAMAAQNFKNGHPLLGTIQMLDSACEVVYDFAAAYGCASIIGAFLASPAALPEKTESVAGLRVPLFSSIRAKSSCALSKVSWSMIAG